MSVLIDDMSELMERLHHVEHLLVTLCRHVDSNLSSNYNLSSNVLPSLSEVAEWWEEKKKQLPEEQTKELRDLAEDIFRCYQNGDQKYIDPADLKRLAQLARKARLD